MILTVVFPSYCTYVFLFPAVRRTRNLANNTRLLLARPSMPPITNPVSSTQTTTTKFSYNLQQSLPYHPYLEEYEINHPRPPPISCRPPIFPIHFHLLRVVVVVAAGAAGAASSCCCRLLSSCCWSCIRASIYYVMRMMRVDDVISCVFVFAVFVVPNRR